MYTMRQWRRSAGLLAALLTLGACDREPKGEPSPYIQELLSGAEGPVTMELPDGDTLTVSEPVIEFYRQRGYRQAWSDYDDIEERGWRLLEVMEAAGEDGLDPERYRYPTAYRMVQQVEEDSLSESDEPRQMAQVDLVLSEVFGRYANHLSGGVIDPSESGLDWRIPKDSADVFALLTSMAAEADPDSVLRALRPDAPEYRLLMQQLARYREIAAQGGWPAVPEGTPTDVGERGDGVRLLRQRLIAEGDAEEVRLAQSGSAAPDRFDEALGDALEHFQVRHGLTADGRIGPATLAELNVDAERRVQQIRLNLDQWRWLPRELGERYILVNVAGFEMEYVEDDSVALAMNVVVGQEGWETPIFADTMESIVFNPYWNVPQSIKQEEVIPAIRRDPGYLTRNNMEAVAGGRAVSPSSLNYGNLEAYSYRQKPGPRNALGQVKFLFPNSDNIYLHDTPADQYFSASSRAFSHGCIRLEKPLELARLLLDRVTERSAGDVEKLISRQGEQWIKVTELLPVYILYFTAWAGRDDTMRFYPDVYERDRRLEEQVTETLHVAAAP